MALPPVTAPSHATRPSTSTSRIYLCMQDNAATFLESKAPAQQKAFSRHRYTFIKHAINSSVRLKTATNSKCSVLLFFGQQFPVCPIASNGLCNRQRVPESKKLKAQSVESTTTQVSFLYCSTGFTLTSKKEQTSTKA